MLKTFFNHIYSRLNSYKFSKIYSKNLFCGTESRSGEGSGIIQTRIISKEIPVLLEQYECNSLLDAPCGDFFWMGKIHLPVNNYTGIDIVEEIINQNNLRYAAPGRIFIRKDIMTDLLPPADIILCRDCLVHLSFSNSFKVLKNFQKTGAKYFLTTTFTDRSRNKDLGKGFWRALNLELPPFNFPKPLRVINENCTEENGLYSDKSLGLWRLEDIHFNG